MINDIDKALQQLITRELPIKNGEIKIEFRPPTRDWSSRLNRPTINIFLHDVRENKTLRQADWAMKQNGNGKAIRQRTPIRLDLHYMITVWGAEPEDEHRLLTRALLVLFLHPEMPVDVLPNPLQEQPRPIKICTAQYEMPHKLTDVWGVMDNEVRPAIDCMITLSLNPYETSTEPLVKTLNLRFAQTQTPLLAQRLDLSDSQDRTWLVGGFVRSKKPLENVHLKLLERGLNVSVAREGQFIIGNLATGTYTLEVRTEGRKPSQHPITVPSASYDIEL